MTESDWDIPGVDRRAAPPGGPLDADAPPQPARPRQQARAFGADGSPRPGPSAGVRPDSPAQALACLAGALDYLAHADAASWPAGVQADCLRALAVAESQQVAAHARALAAFSVPGGGLAGDGHRSPRMWLTWQTQATRRAAAVHVSWMRRLAGHPVIAAALADGQLSVSWARQMTEWTDRLPEDARETRTGRCWTRRGWAPICRAWPTSPRTCAAGTHRPTPMTTGSRTGRCAWRLPSTARDGWKAT